MAGTVFIGSGAPVTVTVPNPANPGEDGKCLRFECDTAQAHVLSGSFVDPINGALASITFSGAIGAFVELIARAGSWRIRAASGTTALPAGSIQITTPISSAQLKNSFTTPIQIAPAPGTGKTYVVLASFLKYIFGTVPYTVVGMTQSGLGYTAAEILAGQVPWWENTQNLLVAAVSAFTQGAPNLGASAIATALNAPLLWGSLGANPAAGDGTLEETILVKIISP